MILSLDKKFIFLHVNRAAGSSITMTLKPYGTRPRKAKLTRFLTKYALLRDPAQMNFAAHMTAREVRSLLPDGMFDEFFTAAFVRNPYDWLVSLYNVFKKSKSHRHRKIVSAMSFSEYIDWEAARGKRSLGRFVTDQSGEVVVDFIGRFERLQQDYEALCERIGVESQKLPVASTARPHADYRTYYDDETRTKVAEHWAADIELFNYSFDGLVDPS